MIVPVRPVVSEFGDHENHHPVPTKGGVEKPVIPKPSAEVLRVALAEIDEKAVDKNNGKTREDFPLAEILEFQPR